MADRALITGITGQDGSYLAEYLLSKGYEVHGLIRRASTPNTGRIDHICGERSDARLFLHYGDLSNSEQLTNLIYYVSPDEVYHLGAQSHVRVSFDMPEYTGDVTGLGTTRILEAIRRSGNRIRFYQASSSELFGSSAPPQNESTPFHPRSPYAVAKLSAYWTTVNYRDGYGIFACNESTSRGALRALESQGRAHEVKMIGFDSAEALLKGLESGRIDALVVQNPRAMGYTGVQSTIAAIKGESVEPRIDTGVELVTKDRLNSPEIRALIGKEG